MEETPRPVITVKEARKLISPKIRNDLSDSQVQVIIGELDYLASLFLDVYRQDTLLEATSDEHS